MKKVGQKTGIEDLASLVRVGFKNINTKLQDVAKKNELEDLARMVQTGFEEVNDKFKEVNNKSREVNDKFKEVRSDLYHAEERLNARIDGLGMNLGRYVSDTEKRIDSIDLRVDKIEDRLAGAK